VETEESDVARLTPLSFEHINLLGRYHFRLEESLNDGSLRLPQDAFEERDLVPVSP